MVGSLPPPHAAGCNRLRLISPSADGNLRTYCVLHKYRNLSCNLLFGLNRKKPLETKSN
jgi:hypothetical protein